MFDALWIDPGTFALMVTAGVTLVASPVAVYGLAVNILRWLTR